MKRVAVIGGGVAGMQTALRLAEQGVEPVIIEKEAELGGKLRGWHVLFPSFTPAQEVLTELRRRVNESGIEVMTSTEVAGFTKESVTLADGRTLPCDSVVVASGFTLFDASIKEEYGYGIYDNVFTTVDIERMLNEGRVARADGSRPRRIAFLHCVGSRDEKVCQQHCSKICCITGVKQAMEMRQMFPEADVFNFYMDIRMFGPGYEEMYREAQQKYNIHFIRGRISEASPMIDGRVQIKAEDTLTGRPLRMSVDMLILIVGMRANDDKYKNGVSQVVIPARLPEEKLDEVKTYAAMAYTALGCEGLARCDFFVEKDTGRVLINEINTFPGFTPISMYPKLMEHEGIPVPALIDRLIALALERTEKQHG